jgi:hypothetical protein
LFDVLYYFIILTALCIVVLLTPMGQFAQSRMLTLEDEQYKNRL